MSIQSDELKERTMSFAVSILRLVDTLPKTTGAQVCGRQLAESATSVGANYVAACTSRSRAEFISKLCIVNEEGDESVFWLEVLQRGRYVPDDQILPLKQEAGELRAIFGRSLSTAGNNARQQHLDRRCDKGSHPQSVKSMTK